MPRREPGHSFFRFYEPVVRAKQMIEAGEIGEPQMIRLHVNTGTQDTAWKVPVSAWAWRFDGEKCGGGPLIVDHGYPLFSLAYYLMGEVERVYAWIDRSPIAPLVYLDAPATIMFQLKAPRRLGRPPPSRWKESSGTIASSPAPGT